MPGAPAALAAVARTPETVPTVVTGNLQGSAEIKLKALGLDRHLDLASGGYASDDAHRLALVRVAVASGTTSPQELAAAGAHHVLPDLTDTRHLLAVIESCTTHTARPR
ncbi:hypothetical protein [Streptomyces sp. DSM 110735]|uniref:hypothetical protein n=1 Tax=Streptomyces sp. DSM 110735 TaxID=2775031 RepID=UPI001F5BE799|nr:hypothetical protein [Streptomyces sp. DSM 110735]